MDKRDLFWMALKVSSAVLLMVPVTVEIIRRKTLARDERILLLLMVFTALRLMTAALGPLLYGVAHFTLWYSLLMFFSYLVALVNITLFSGYILQFIRRFVYVPHSFEVQLFVSCAALALLNALLFCLGKMFHTDLETGRPVFDTAFYVMLFATALPMTVNVAILIHYHRHYGLRKLIVFLSYFVLTGLALPMIFILGTAAPAHLVSAQAVLWMFGIVHANQNTDAVRQKASLGTAQAKLVFSQMQPHFIFNALDTIYYLAGENPEQAKTAISDFSDYLRANFVVSGVHEPLPFKMELQHIETYLKLEKLRFEERLNVVWDIRAKNFMLPPLSVQPLVENAVKHGVTKRPEGGTVIIRTEERRHEYRISVKDNGVGFDPASVNESDEKRTHIGIAGVRRCLSLMCGGRLEIQSTPGFGTSAVVIIPKTAATAAKEAER